MAGSSCLKSGHALLPAVLLKPWPPNTHEEKTRGFRHTVDLTFKRKVTKETSGSVILVSIPSL